MDIFNLVATILHVSFELYLFTSFLKVKNQFDALRNKCEIKEKEESQKVMILLQKDEFDKIYSRFIETGFLRPEDYFRLKKMFHQGFLS